MNDYDYTLEAYLSFLKAGSRRYKNGHPYDKRDYEQYCIALAYFMELRPKLKKAINEESEV